MPTAQPSSSPPLTRIFRLYMSRNRESPAQALVAVNGNQSLVPFASPRAGTPPIDTEEPNNAPSAEPEPPSDEQAVAAAEFEDEEAEPPAPAKRPHDAALALGRSKRHRGLRRRMARAIPESAVKDFMEHPLVHHIRTSNHGMVRFADPAQYADYVEQLLRISPFRLEQVPDPFSTAEMLTFVNIGPVAAITIDYLLAARFFFPDDPSRQMMMTGLAQVICRMHNNERRYFCSPCPLMKKQDDGGWHCNTVGMSRNSKKRSRALPSVHMSPGTYVTRTPPLRTLPRGLRVWQLPVEILQILVAFEHDYVGYLGAGDDVQWDATESDDVRWVRQRARFPFVVDDDGNAACPDFRDTHVAQMLRACHMPKTGRRRGRCSFLVSRGYWVAGECRPEAFNTARRPADQAELPLVFGPILIKNLSRRGTQLRLPGLMLPPLPKSTRATMTLFPNPVLYVEYCRTEAGAQFRAPPRLVEYVPLRCNDDDGGSEDDEHTESDDNVRE